MPRSWEAGRVVQGGEAVLDEDGEVFHPKIDDLDALDVTQRVNEAIEGDGIDSGG